MSEFSANIWEVDLPFSSYCLSTKLYFEFDCSRFYRRVIHGFYFHECIFLLSFLGISVFLLVFVFLVLLVFLDG